MFRYVLASALLLIVMPSSVFASPCPTGGMNFVADISWGCVFPIRIGGVAEFGPNEAENNDTSMNPICVCNGGTVPRVGLSVSFWEPSRLIDTVSDPYCMMPLGTKLTNPRPGQLDGTLRRTRSESHAFQQMHYYIFPAWKILDMFTDVPCMEDAGFDVAMMTEVLPTWNNDILSLIVNPETVLFANPAAALACAAESSSALFNKSINQLFWCMGSWGMTYPLAGTIHGSDYVEANAGLAARATYLMGRLGLVRDTGLDGCTFQFSPIWKKDRYKLQLAKPVRESSCHAIGQSGLLWSGNKHNLINQDNFMWVQFHKLNCCISYEYN